MAVTATDVRTLAPAFTGVSDAVINLWLSWAPQHVAAARFGADHDQAVLLWVCHNLQVTRGSAAGAAGPVTSVEAGDVKASFGVGGMDSSGLKRTSWGQQLETLMRQKVGMPRVV